MRGWLHRKAAVATEAKEKELQGQDREAQSDNTASEKGGEEGLKGEYAKVNVEDPVPLLF